MANNQRKYYRLPYPDSIMPTIQIGESEYLVPEISEGGLRIRQCRRVDSSPFLEFEVGEEVTGTITFDDGDTVCITGVIFRRDKEEYVIAPLDGITFRRVVLEQRRILHRFPSLRSK